MTTPPQRRDPSIRLTAALTGGMVALVGVLAIGLSARLEVPAVFLFGIMLCIAGFWCWINAAEVDRFFSKRDYAE